MQAFEVAIQDSFTQNLIWADSILQREVPSCDGFWVAALDTLAGRSFSNLAFTLSLSVVSLINKGQIST